MNICTVQNNEPNRHKKYKCSECNSRFTTFTYLQCHTMVVHRGVSPFRCQFCSRAFTTALILENHVRTHTGDRPFVCSICGKGFAQKGTLIKHGKTHVKMTGIQLTTSFWVAVELTKHSDTKIQWINMEYNYAAGCASVHYEATHIFTSLLSLNVWYHTRISLSLYPYLCAKKMMSDSILLYSPFYLLSWLALLLMLCLPCMH